MEIISPLLQYVKWAVARKALKWKRIAQQFNIKIIKSKGRDRFSKKEFERRIAERKLKDEKKLKLKKVEGRAEEKAERPRPPLNCATLSTSTSTLIFFHSSHELDTLSS